MREAQHAGKNNENAGFRADRKEGLVEATFQGSCTHEKPPPARPLLRRDLH